MSSEIVVNGIHYIPSKEAAAKVGFVADYVSRMCREKLVDGKLVSGAWYVNESSLTKFLARQKQEEALRRASQAQLLREERRPRSAFPAPATSAPRPRQISPSPARQVAC